MERVHRDARRRVALGRTPTSHGGLGVFLLSLLVLAAAASAACRGPAVSEGIGGQSGDEGRRSTPTWLGTGGVAAVPQN